MDEHAERYGRLDILVNSAGVGIAGPVDELSAKQIDLQLDAAKVYSRPIVTKLEPFHAFYPAESYHQDYLKNNPDNPYIVYNDLPKLENLKKDFPNLYRP